MERGGDASDMILELRVPSGSPAALLPPPADGRGNELVLPNFTEVLVEGVGHQDGRTTIHAVVMP